VRETGINAPTGAFPCQQEITMLRLALVTALLSLPVAAVAQQGPPAVDAQAETGAPPKRIRNIALTGDQKCPPSTGDEVVVCSRINPDEQYRIPKPLREPANPAKNQSWVNRTTVGERASRAAAGLPDTCSPVGTGGQSGCGLLINRNFADEKRAAEKNDSMAP
jgi:hypothetical protein